MELAANKSNKKNLLFIGILTLVVLLAGAGYFCFQYYQKTNSSLEILRRRNLSLQVRNNELTQEARISPNINIDITKDIDGTTYWLQSDPESYYKLKLGISDNGEFKELPTPGLGDFLSSLMNEDVTDFWLDADQETFLFITKIGPADPTTYEIIHKVEFDARTNLIRDYEIVYSGENALTLGKSHIKSYNPETGQAVMTSSTADGCGGIGEWWTLTNGVRRRIVEYSGGCIVSRPHLVKRAGDWLVLAEVEDSVEPTNEGEPIGQPIIQSLFKVSVYSGNREILPLDNTGGRYYSFSFLPQDDHEQLSQTEILLREQDETNPNHSQFYTYDINTGAMNPFESNSLE